MTTSTPAPSPTPGAAPAPADWTTGLDADSLGFIQTKGFKNPGDLLGSYRNLEKLLGAGPDKLLKLPSDDKPESWDPVFQKLGRPAKPEEYELALPEQLKDATEFQDFLRKTMHGLGFSARQAREFSKAFGENIVQGMTAEQKAAEEKARAASAQQEATLKTKWGASYDANVAAARKAIQTFGLDAGAVDAIEAAVGFAKTMELFHGIGSRLGEAPYTGGEPSRGFGMTQQQAQQELAQLRVDVGFAQRLGNGDVEAKARWDRLHQIAFPGMQTF